MHGDLVDRLPDLLTARGRELVDAALAAARDLLGMELSFISQLTSDEQIYRYVGGDAESFQLPEGHVGVHEHGYCVRMVQGLIPNIVPDVRADARTADVLATLALDIGAYVGVPVRLPDGSLYGSFCCLSHRSQPGLDARSYAMMALLARLIADELQREIVRRRVTRMEVEASASQALLAALAARERYTGEHSRAVLDLALSVGSLLELPDDDLTTVGQVALLHDIGKVGVPDRILGKPGPLDPDEEARMREHVRIGAEVLAGVQGLEHLAAAVRAEHERWDGTGYPDGLAGEEIPLASRVCLACDAYDAMTTDRPYRRALGHDAAVGELAAGAGTQFDPVVVDALLRVLPGQAPSGTVSPVSRMT